MLYQSSLYTVESVTAGHPDKICDQISDAILDACLEQDPLSRVAVEVFGSHGHLVIGGEVTTNALVDYAAIARRVYTTIGYNPTTLKSIDVRIAQQSTDIARGVADGGAGDQGIMYGYATDENIAMLPTGLILAHKLARDLHYCRLFNKQYAWLGPDGKTQVTIKNGAVETVVISAQHDAGIDISDVRTALCDIVHRVTNSVPVIHCNPAGAFTVGGFEADTGLTGRKIMVDTYGGLIPHGGGAFSGKDATKVDRSAAYACRAAAVWAVRSGYARRCLVAVAYAIGQAEPVMVQAINENNRDLSGIVRTQFDFRPLAIIERFGLRRPIFHKTAVYGHFGKDGLPWE